MGSKPAYTVIGPRCASAANVSRSVDCAINPRQLSSSRIMPDIPQDSSRWLPGPVPASFAGRPTPPVDP